MTQTSSSAISTQQLQGFEDFIHSTMRDWKLPGLAIAIIKNGEVILSQGFGKRDIAQGLDVTPQTLFPIGSCTKAFTTTSMGILIDEGKLDWDTPVRTYLPTFKMYDAFATERMTPRDLVTHRSGLPRHDLAWYNSTRSRKELVESLQYLEPSKDFRTIWQYQNLMYMTAGYLVGELAGQSWEEFVQQRILIPLGMTTGTFSITQAKQTLDFSMPYKKEEKGEIKETIFYDTWQAIAPAGALVSNVMEMSQWLLLQLNKGKHGDTQIISEAQLEQIHTPQIIMPGPRKYRELSHNSYAMGWAVTMYKGHLMLEHGGGINGFSALTTLLPDDNIGIVALSNREGCPAHNIIMFNACDRLLGLEEIPWSERMKKDVEEWKDATEKSKEKSGSDRVPETHPSHALDAYTGEFEHPGYGTITVQQEGDTLQFTFNTMAFSLKHYHYDVFEARFDFFDMDMKVAFSSNLKGDVDSLAVQFEPEVKEIVFKRVASKEIRERSANS